MSRRRNKEYLSESIEDLLEINLFEDDEDPETEGDEDPEAEGDDLDFSDLGDLGDEDEDEGGSDSSLSQDDADLLRDIALKIEDEIEEVEVVSDESDDDAEDDEEEDEDPNESFMRESDIFELDDEDPEAEGKDPNKSIDVIEIDENMLRREIGKMKRLREGDAADMASHFGGGSLDKEMFVDVDEGLLNALDDQVGDAPTPSLKKEVALRKNAQRKNRLMQKQLKEHKSALRSMKKQLNEMNLFNAKLLYANKLMQNRDLSIKQQKHIVESLDNANTLNEAKLLFESLSKSLTKSRKGRNLNEGASRRILGSSSRSVSSSQSVNKSADLDRWATLAGIKK
jgi:hypothetical protein